MDWMREERVETTLRPVLPVAPTIRIEGAMVGSRETNCLRGSLVK